MSTPETPAEKEKRLAALKLQQQRKKARHQQEEQEEEDLEWDEQQAKLHKAMENPEEEHADFLQIEQQQATYANKDAAALQKIANKSFNKFKTDPNIPMHLKSASMVKGAALGFAGPHAVAALAAFMAFEALLAKKEGRSPLNIEVKASCKDQLSAMNMLRDFQAQGISGSLKKLTYMENGKEVVKQGKELAQMFNNLGNTLNISSPGQTKKSQKSPFAIPNPWDIKKPEPK